AVVTASNAEGLSNVLVETLACGTVAITTDVSGARDALDPDCAMPDPIPSGQFAEGLGGLVVPIGDRDALARGMEAVLVDAEMRRRLARAARARAESAYSAAACTADFLRAV